jgi:hypothetical protein
VANLSLFLISQNENLGYDTFDSAVVCAESAADTRQMHPECSWEHIKFSDKQNAKQWTTTMGFTWAVRPGGVSVRRLGPAYRVARGIVLASFNAG